MQETADHDKKLRQRKPQPEKVDKTSSGDTKEIKDDNKKQRKP